MVTTYLSHNTNNRALTRFKCRVDRLLDNGAAARKPVLYWLCRAFVAAYNHTPRNHDRLNSLMAEIKQLV
jgi:hypothetical protein